jgi:hypothetical protein
MVWRGFNFASKSKKEDNMNLIELLGEALVNARKWKVRFHIPSQGNVVL